MPTIRSRCQVVTFQPLNQEDFVTAAQTAGIITDAKAAEAIYPLAQGSLSRAALMQDAELLKITGDIAKAFQSPKFASVAFGTMLVKFCDGVKEGALKRQRAHFAVEFVVQLLQAALLQVETSVPTSNPHQQAITRLASLTNIDALPLLLETAMEAEHHIDRRFQLALLLEVFADRMGRVLS